MILLKKLNAQSFQMIVHFFLFLFYFLKVSPWYNRSMSGEGAAFYEAYGKLNTEQKRAVDAVEGPVMVVAGPGTGKTQILTLRIANILEKTDAEPEQILALTFTEAAAGNMRKRLATLIGNDAYRVVINTFHGFCNDIIKRYPEDFPRIVGSKSITEVDQVSLIEEIIETEKLTLLKPFGDRFLYVRDILATISELKREGFTATKFKELVATEKKSFTTIEDLYHEKGAHKGKMKADYQKLERKILKNEELGVVYQRYQALLFERKLYDFSDMILEVLEALKENQSLLQMLQEEHQYVLVDEHQDTNNAQNAILERLLSFHENPNLFVVGDIKQAIFRFQGASLENFQYFKRLYPRALLVTLTQNYRSTKSILDSAESLLPGEAVLEKNTAFPEKPIQIALLPSPRLERYFVADEIAQSIKNGVIPEEIAVLYRNNKDAFPLAQELEKRGVPYTIESDQDLFSQRDVRAVLTIMEAITYYGNDLLLTPFFHLPLFGLDPLDVYKLLRSAADRKKYSLYDIFTSKELLSEISFKDKTTILTLSEKLSLWVKESKKQDLLPFFEYIVRESGLLESILESAEMLDRFEAINSLFDEVRELISRKSDATLGNFFSYIETIRKHNLFLKRKREGNGTGRVRLMTVHRSKGLEFAHVYIVGAVHGVYGGKIDRDRLPLIDAVYGNVESSDSSDDERRLFYVALTRAKETVTITYSTESDDRGATLPSVFISELRPELLEYVDTSRVVEKLATHPELLFAAPQESLVVSKIDERSFIQELFMKQGLSPTGLNNYLECPWKYFYQNLIRIPTAQTKHQAYGTAVHGALADFFEHRKKETVGEKYLLTAFESWINRVPLAPRDFEETKAKGERALSGWFATYEHSWNMRVQTEYRINGVEIENGVKLTGVLDKIEWNDDDTVTVVDYKTGKPKSRNELLGKTKTADGNYVRQLTFYKLLLSHFKEGQYVMSEGVLDFIEPDEKGSYHKESFDITNEMVAELQTQITRVAGEIMSLSFWETTCSLKDCEFCKLRNMMRFV